MQIKSIQSKGNTATNLYYEGNMNNNQKPSSNSDNKSREDFIRAKYERKEFYSKNGKVIEEKKIVDEEEEKIEKRIKKRTN